MHSTVPKKKAGMNILILQMSPAGECLLRGEQRLHAAFVHALVGHFLAKIELGQAEASHLKELEFYENW